MATTPHAFAFSIEQEIRKAFHTSTTPRNKLRYDADEISQGKLFEAMCCLLEFYQIGDADLEEFKKKYSFIQGKYLHEIENWEEIEVQFTSILRCLNE